MPSSSSRGIFLSYRRQETMPFAGLLYDRLADRFGEGQVFMDFMDVDAKPGADFAKAIRAAVGSCAVLVVLIGPQWVGRTDEVGRRWLDRPDDFVRLEVQAALERGVRVIPVLVDGARPLRQHELPAELQELSRLHALEMSRTRYADDVDRLVTLIQEVLGEGPDVRRAAAADTSTPVLRTTNWLRGVRAREGRSVFISFRHELSEMLARSVNDALIKHHYDTFVAMENLGSGEFPQAILRQIERRQHFVVLLEPGSLDRIGNDGDWLRREIAHALAHDRNVIPVTHKGFKFRHDLVLPPDVARLPTFNAVDIPSGYFPDAMGKLCTRFLKASNP